MRRNADVSIGDTARGIPWGPGVSIGVVPRPPQRAWRAIGLLAVIGDSRCGSVASRVRMNGGKNIMKQKKMFGPCAVAVIGLLLVCMTVASVSAENGLHAVAINGGSLLINEDGGIDCTASADTYAGSYIPGVTYQIDVDCEYRDYNEVVGQTAQFRLEGPDGSVATKSIFDVPLINNNWKGKLSVPFTPASPGSYHWEITCSEGSESASARGDLILV